MTLRHFVERLERLSGALATFFHWTGIGLILPALMLLVTVDVFMRYVFGGSIPGATEVGQLMLLVVLFASLPYCTLRHGHVYMELLYNRFTGGIKRLADGLAAIAGLAFFAAFTWHAARNTMDMFKFGDGAEMVKLPFWPFASILLLCGLLMILAFSLQLLRAILDMPIVRESIDHE